MTAKLERGVVGVVKRCEDGWCAISGPRLRRLRSSRSGYGAFIRTRRWTEAVNLASLVTGPPLASDGSQEQNCVSRRWTLIGGLSVSDLQKAFPPIESRDNVPAVCLAIAVVGLVLGGLVVAARMHPVEAQVAISMGKPTLLAHRD